MKNDNKKVFLVGGQGYGNYINWVLDMGFESTESLKDSDLVFFTGGSDVDPSFYGHEQHITTGPNTQRDVYEKSIFDASVNLNKKLWGCCRGAQALCAYQPKGYLIQHASHPSSHYGTIKETGEQILLTSSHHQMMAPFDINHKVIVFADNLSPFHLLGDNTDIECNEEPEIVYFPDIKGIGSQSHVEWQFRSNNKEEVRTVKYHQELLTRLMNDEM